MPEKHEINPNHAGVRDLLRVIGPLLMFVGGVCILVAGIDFFSVMASGLHGGMSGGPKLFWLFFVGMPLLAIGGMMSQFAFMGAVARYVAEETAPVAVDTANYVGKASAPGITAIARAISEGLEGTEASRACPACGTGNDAEARFCDACGHALGNRVCPSCKQENDPEARFCDGCGTALGGS